MADPSHHPSSKIQADRRDALVAKANLCQAALVEATRLASIRSFDGRFWQLLARADDLLEEIDEVLVGLHPVSEAAEFTRARELRRELEFIKAAMRNPPQAHYHS